MNNFQGWMRGRDKLMAINYWFLDSTDYGATFVTICSVWYEITFTVGMISIAQQKAYFLKIFSTRATSKSSADLLNISQNYSTVVHFLQVLTLHVHLLIRYPGGIHKLGNCFS